MGDVEALTIGPGCEVTMHFCLSMKNGIVADATEEGQPMTFKMGDGSMIHGLEMAIYGLKVGDKQSVELDPLNAFGYADPDNVHTMVRNEFADDLPLEPGTVIGFSTPAGDEVPGTIKEVQGEEVVVDFNHPLAGHDLIFDVEILDIKPPVTQQDAQD
jgi:FKBP-type peptidyl-prolyl cis-trans isomerase SlpA